MVSSHANSSPTPPVFYQVEAAGSLLCILDGFSTAAVPQCATASGQVRYEVTLLDMGVLYLTILKFPKQRLRLRVLYNFS